MTALLMQLNDKIVKGTENIVSKQNNIANEQIVYIVMYGLPGAVVKHQSEDNTLSHGFAALITTDGGLTFSVEEDSTQKLNKHYTLDALLNTLQPKEPSEALFNHHKLFQHSRNDIATQLKNMFELKSQHPDLSGLEIYALNQKLKDDPATKQDRAKVIELIASIKQGSTSDDLRQYQGSKPSLRR